MKDHIDYVRNQASKNKDLLGRIFAKVRQAINERETDIKWRIAEVILVQEEYIDSKKQGLES